MTQNGLATLEAAERMLAEVATIEDAYALINLAEQARIYARQSKLGTASINHATIIKVRAERRLADIVDEGQARGEIATQERGGANIPNGVRSANTVSTLPELGVDRQRLAEARVLRDAYTDSDLRQRQERANASDRVLSHATLIREARKTPAQEPPPLPPGLFDVILADPPWAYDNQIESWGPTSLHYPPMPLADICRLPVPAAGNAVLFLWVTNPFLRDAFGVVDAWGFEYKTNIVWVKRNLARPGSGFYVRGRHELLFVCTRGRMVPDQAGRSPVGSVLEADAGEHSAKPDEVYALIESIYPGRACLELFARRNRPGWTAWGNDSALLLAGTQADNGGRA